MSLSDTFRSQEISHQHEEYQQLREFVFRTTGKQVTHLTMLSGGANNRVLLADCGDIQFVVKKFNSKSNKTPSKFAAEQAFYRLTNTLKRQVRLGLQCPEILADSESDYLLLLSFVDSELTVDARMGELVDTTAKSDFFKQFTLQSLQFFEHLNLNKTEVSQLPLASDATATFEHLINQLNHRRQTLNNGLSKLRNSLGQDNLNTQCQTFVDKELTPWFEKISQQASILNQVTFPIDIASPSDVGLHNVMIEKSSYHFIFLDFEYAGRDSAIKLVCDYFCQPKYPVPVNLISEFFRHPLFVQVFDDEEIFLLFFRATQLKWCFILLNEFNPDIIKRREFSSAKPLDLSKLQKSQLNKCRQYFHAALVRFNEIEQAIKQFQLNKENEANTVPSGGAE